MQAGSGQFWIALGQPWGTRGFYNRVQTSARGVPGPSAPLLLYSAVFEPPNFILGAFRLDPAPTRGAHLQRRPCCKHNELQRVRTVLDCTRPAIRNAYETRGNPLLILVSERQERRAHSLCFYSASAYKTSATHRPNTFAITRCRSDRGNRCSSADAIHTVPT